ncbi:MAG: type II toxin-antitoxin system VapC family toxin [candidate division NC10 bacterium]|nr:type II toxin-antitoxin system VapC family toxin [candidate division NC10 bacterium]
MTPLVLDTSVIFKWSRQPHEEPLVPQALALLDQYLSGETDIRVPELLFYELGNTIKQKRHLLYGSEETILRDVFTLGLTVHRLDMTLAQETLRIALEHDVTFYDATFIAVAQSVRCNLITADRKLHQKLRALPFVRFLGDVHIPA